jgi:hypothetical protein
LVQKSNDISINFFIFIGYQKSSIHLAQPVALAAIQLAVKGLKKATTPENMDRTLE